LGLTVDFRSTHWPNVGLLTFRGGGRAQFNFDDATRANGLDRQSDLVPWWWVGATVALGGDARRMR